MAITEKDTAGYVAITGCGWVMPSGAGSHAAIGDAARSHAAPENAPRLQCIPNALFETLAIPTGELAGDRNGRIASAALTLAAQQAGLTLPFVDPTRIGLVLSVAQAGQGGMIRFAEEVRTQSPRFVSPIHFPETVGNYLAAALARAYGLRGPNLTVSGGAGAGIEAFGEAAQMIQHGAADVVVVGGCEAWVSPVVTQSPTEHEMVTEGACFVVLEREDAMSARGAGACAFGRCHEYDAAAAKQADIRVSVTGTCADALCIEERWGYGPSAGPLLAIAAALCAAAGRSGAQTAVVLPGQDADGMSMLSLRIPVRHTA